MEGPHSLAGQKKKVKKQRVHSGNRKMYRKERIPVLNGCFKKVQTRRNGFEDKNKERLILSTSIIIQKTSL